MKIDVYTQYDPPCSYCMATKAHLNKEKIQFNEYVLGKDLTKNELMEQFPMARTLPIILIDGKYVGGYDQLRNRLLGEAVSGMSL
tara:strand:- start:388 stop:642 length:255 start_codon:yes stop_codon:yes gene_type:complete